VTCANINILLSLWKAQKAGIYGLNVSCCYVVLFDVAVTLMVAHR
jgi:hypothetical protein